MIAHRSLLFAPANRPAIHSKALASGADIVCLDLEDAVPPAEKSAARENALSFLSDAPGPERVVRINGLRSADGLRDIVALLDARPTGGTICLPKVATADEVRMTSDLIDEAAVPLRIAVLIESLEGLHNVAGILRASSRISFAMFGAVDYAAELGVEVEPEPLFHARTTLVHAAKLAGVDILDVPCLAFRDDVAVAAEAEMAKALGFTGKAALHPGNVATLNTIFSPSAQEIAHAEKVVELFKASPNGLAVLDGKLIEKPVIRSMQRILALRDAQTQREG
ncbi:CoA ester lyase [Ponticoccus sp. SC2-23]|uniref:HpcH/HpaI aldolase/citrate lyase family protein n=1 Tax=Alexandriicola marinus TaxID=2081710 RepID=UPI000FD70D24|nr:CoA ester lyase [Alexandriicola marinus]MBM1221409.1 CoA ester lyase [Ponticoccus sp. SC6-9]MBM1226450.1 CoA ester lyase [Ponticoccus sp. SC6-15]MBM1230401.1 CoA ester lyase [Ponticoccus sp. SC6-38]MBM1234924.1 CoA ester lyase [Ponticoccus sp. SC6-45]MBM1239422.1 CoA ester lyase [Ponticoccus sp. SC6-49]MBM1243204.1 CoA ester lyase [Ponticoccus sp. SC2-64]MBM1248448.1 CoA ester lyase [Ponticoccus sp. SC6-42]MBM1253033.1 CoA ester lyase [Ponticoccus sp. SC6-33]MBM1257431.1 CoA ester lyase